MTTKLGIDVNGKPYHRWFLILSVLLGGFMTVLTETLLNNGLPTISRSGPLSIK